MPAHQMLRDVQLPGRTHKLHVPGHCLENVRDIGPYFMEHWTSVKKVMPERLKWHWWGGSDRIV
jgi:hypothetical protein